ncbi:exocyst complex component EXO70B1-like [Gastrolobium bilobum]|uniref:exocyst complex component EXO70B1-like n=1 Tax=Gastrolobium bilobum TaxID=150636 RepID=UPI002AB20121|nr:exocyst complex component EXO70B1-like [Gastrolobium bilobum]
MSLSLSRQIDLGFEVDLFNFFLGCLMVQLMSIHWELAIVGAVFCYLLMYLNSHLDSQTQSETFNLAEHVTVEIDDANSVQVGAGSQCNQELIYTILGIEEKREDTVIFPTDMEARLREAIVAGFVDECYHIYFTWRRQILDPKLLKIGLHKLDIKEIKNVPLNYLEKKIQRWIMASNYVLRAQLPEERKLCNLVFSSYSLHADIAFMKISRGSMTQLLNFANAVATGTGSPERLFRILKVFEALRELLPEMESLFSDQYSVTLRDEAIAICEKLREAIKSVFKDLENMLCQDPPTRVTVPGGGLHPITHYIMNYLRAACQSLRTLEYVFENENLEMSLSSPLSFQVVRIMELLERYLEANSKMYQGPCLHFVFMMNNVRYIVQTAKHSELRQLLGELWIQKHIAQVRQYLVNYERSSWDQVLGMFKVDNDHVFVESFKQKLSLLILQFEGICKVQSTWVIFDERLREKIISSLKKILLPAYENFSARFQNVMETQEDTNIYSDLGFGIQDIVTGIDKLFQGRDELKKHRNMQPTWTIVLPINKDFYEWRKRGQDAFLNSSYPRDYYWCIHKFDQGCQATKQVQQIQENPTKFMTRYTGLHTCRMGANAPGMLTEANTHETFIVNHPDQ